MIPTEEKMEMETSDFFGTERISRILLKMAPPVMLAQLIQALYNIVDSLFVGRFSESGLTALSIIYPRSAADFRSARTAEAGCFRRSNRHRCGTDRRRACCHEKRLPIFPCKGKISALY